MTVSTERVEANLLVIPGNETVYVSLPVGENKVQVVNEGERFVQVSHVADKLALEIPSEDLGTSRSLVER